MAFVHLVAHAPSGWGHTKPLLALFARMVQFQGDRNLMITFLSSSPVLPAIERELRMLRLPVSDRLNVVDVGVAAAPLEPIMGVLTALEALRDGKPVVCKTSSKEYALPPATVVLLDVMSTPPVSDVRAAAGGVPVIAWASMPMSSCLHLFGPEELGGFGDLKARVTAAAKAQNKTEAEVAGGILEPRGAVVRRPGVPDMYDYEFPMGEKLVNISPVGMLTAAHNNVTGSNGMIIVASSAFERESIVAGRQWLAALGQDVWTVGPLEDTPPITTADVSGGKHIEDTKILEFLDRMEKHYGSRSVIYISFGTFFHPQDPAKLYALIDELLVTGTPFLWSHASPFAKVPEELAARIAESRHGFHAAWAPQRAVLKHAATGWFISHGGWNSLQEALSLRVPTIMWPFGGDQNNNAALMSITHGAAFELLSVRESAARQPLRMHGRTTLDFSLKGTREEMRALLAKLKGEEGEHVRANAERLGDALDLGWKEGGEAREELERFLTTLCAL